MTTPKDVELPHEPVRKSRAARSTDKDFGLVVGVDHYAPLPSLVGAVEDAKRFYEWMCDPNGGGVPTENARLVVSSAEPLRPLQDQVDEALVELMQQVVGAAEGGQRFYFHFSGHGASSPKANRRDVALLLATWSRIFHRRALSSDHYCEHLAKLGLFQEVAIFLDCCRTVVDTVLGAQPSFQLTPITEQGDADTFIAYATRRGAKAFEAQDKSGWQGVFTKCLLSILRSWPSPVRAEDLRQELQKRIANDKQRAHVINELCDDSTFGKGRIPRLEITFRRVQDGRVWLVDEQMRLVAEHQAPDPWVMWRPPGVYLLEHATTAGILIDHGRTEVTRVEF